MLKKDLNIYNLSDFILNSDKFNINNKIRKNIVKVLMEEFEKCKSTEGQKSDLFCFKWALDDMYWVIEDIVIKELRKKDPLPYKDAYQLALENLDFRSLEIIQYTYGFGDALGHQHTILEIINKCKKYSIYDIIIVYFNFAKIILKHYK